MATKKRKMYEGTDGNCMGRSNPSGVDNVPQPVGRPEALQSVNRDNPLYNMTRGKKGLAVIFKMENYPDDRKREGASHDAMKCKEAFAALEFEVIIFSDLRKDQFLEALDNIRTKQLDTCNCLVVVFMGHGGKDEETGVEIIELIDGKKVPTSELWKLFSADECPDMAGQPKLYFIQSCRGLATEGGIKMKKWSNWDADDVSEPDEYVIPLHSDMLMMWASYPETKAYRNFSSTYGINGSVFIHYLCQVLMSDSAREDLLSMLVTVTRKVGIRYETPAGVKQLPHLSSTLMRKVFFHEMSIEDKSEKLMEIISTNS